MKVLTCSVALYLALMATAFACDLEVTGPWVREAPPTAAALAGYMILANGGSRPCVLTGVRAADFDRAMLHRTEHDGDMAHMTHQNEVRIPAGEQVAFEPNGLHIMLMHPRQPLNKGDSVAITLVLESGDRVRVELPVRDSPPR